MKGTTPFFPIAINPIQELSPLTVKVNSCNIKTIAITDHAAVEMCIKSELDTERRCRWRMNTSVLQDKHLKTLLGEDLKSLFEINIGSTENILSVSEASKAYIRGTFMAHSVQKKRESAIKIKELETEIKIKKKRWQNGFLNHIIKNSVNSSFSMIQFV